MISSSRTNAETPLICSFTFTGGRTLDRVSLASAFLNARFQGPVLGKTRLRRENCAEKSRNPWCTQRRAAEFVPAGLLQRSTRHAGRVGGVCAGFLSLAGLCRFRRYRFAIDHFDERCMLPRRHQDCTKVGIGQRAKAQTFSRPSPPSPHPHCWTFIWKIYFATTVPGVFFVRLRSLSSLTALRTI